MFTDFCFKHIYPSKARAAALGDFLIVVSRACNQFFNTVLILQNILRAAKIMGDDGAFAMSLKPHMAKLIQFCVCKIADLPRLQQAIRVIRDILCDNRIYDEDTCEEFYDFVRAARRRQPALSKCRMIEWWSKFPDKKPSLWDPAVRTDYNNLVQAPKSASNELDEYFNAIAAPIENGNKFGWTPEIIDCRQEGGQGVIEEVMNRKADLKRDRLQEEQKRQSHLPPARQNSSDDYYHDRGGNSRGYMGGNSAGYAASGSYIGGRGGYDGGSGSYRGGRGGHHYNRYGHRGGNRGNSGYYRGNRGGYGNNY